MRCFWWGVFQQQGASGKGVAGHFQREALFVDAAHALADFGALVFIGAQHFHRFVTHAHGGFKGFAHKEIGLRFHQFECVLAVESAHNQPRVGAGLFGDFHNVGGGVGIVDANQNAVGIFCAGGMQNVFARAAFFPNISLTSSMGTASAELSGLFGSGSTAWAFSPSISLPIFNAGRLKNNLELTEIRRDLAVASYEKTVQQAFREVSDALSGQQWLARQRDIAQNALAVQTERARLSQLRYDHGSAAFLDVLDAQRDLLTAQQQAVQAYRALLSSQVSLYAALGGGTLTEPTPSTQPTQRETP